MAMGIRSKVTGVVVSWCCGSGWLARAPLLKIHPADAAPAASAPESGFIESTFGAIFGDSESGRERKPRDPDAPRYVKSLR